MAHHHHHPHEHHPHDTRAQAHPSFLRLSVAERLLAVGVVIAALWGALLWAMT